MEVGIDISLTAIFRNGPPMRKTISESGRQDAEPDFNDVTYARNGPPDSGTPTSRPNLHLGDAGSSWIYVDNVTLLQCHVICSS